ncbi:transaldolase family protein [Clostridium sp. MCC353]|uniref:transaldolase family protein n=1 Tax=Clostridium sp. MCC353 TaxID=2592646 RepID=UPI001C024D43|nr:transaldolase family protein [Clostridium sp. MCC353]
MKILIDTADITVIKQLYTLYHFDGVTTNPTLLSKIEGRPLDILKEIREAIPEEAQLHAEVISDRSDVMVKEAYHILDVAGGNTYIKIPVCTEGYRAIRILSENGVKVTATAIFNQAQAALAAHEGAVFAAPYIHRINNKGYDGVGTALEIQKLLTAQQCKTGLLAAAFENVAQVAKVLESGAKALTVTPDILMEMIENSLTEGAVKNFYSDFSQHFQQENMLEK